MAGAFLVSVNVGSARNSAPSDIGVTGIDKRPVNGAVDVRDPGPKGVGGSGLKDDAVCDVRHHGGHDQAVYAYAREDLDWWQSELGRELRGGVFGENLTTAGVDVSGALVGERWRIGDSCVLQVTDPRIPCRTFAGWLRESGWERRFTEHGAPGAYMRVVSPGPVQAGDPIVIVYRPSHDVTLALAFRALTMDRDLMERLLEAGDDLPVSTRDHVLRRLALRGG
jgi:MOSC domain-containing protein YiiM